MTLLRLPESPPIGVPGAYATDRLADLLEYRPGRPTDLGRQAFLRLALHRLEVGHHAVTRVAGGRLVAGWWAATLAQDTLGAGAHRSPSRPAVLIYGPFPAAGPDRERLTEAVLAELLASVRTLESDGVAYLAIDRASPGFRDEAISAIAAAGGAAIAEVTLDEPTAAGASPADDDGSLVARARAQLARAWPREERGSE